jgi:hypothetical protein
VEIMCISRAADVGCIDIGVVYMGLRFISSNIQHLTQIYPKSE